MVATMLRQHFCDRWLKSSILHGLSKQGMVTPDGGCGAMKRSGQTFSSPQNYEPLHWDNFAAKTTVTIANWVGTQLQRQVWCSQGIKR